MQTDLINEKLGNVGNLDLSLSAGMLLFKLDAVPTAGVSLGLVASVDGGLFLDKLAALIPGTFDDALIGIAKAALLGK